MNSTDGKNQLTPLSAIYYFSSYIHHKQPMWFIRCPSLRAIRFHGNKEERESLSEEYFTNEAAAHDGRRPEKQIVNEKGELEDDNSDNPRAWDVCVTTYEVANTEKKALGRFAWKYLVIDEAHRLVSDVDV
jgi:SWI/SNF-related matrix-associated actin-dependent regulator of chromatin subfamily A member 5